MLIEAIVELALVTQTVTSMNREKKKEPTHDSILYTTIIHTRLTISYASTVYAFHLNYYDYIWYDEPIYLYYALRFILLANSMRLN